MKIVGAKQMIGKIMALRAGFKTEVGRAIYMEAQIELTEAKKRVPVDTGTLRASGFVTTPEIGPGDRISVRIGFGGAASDYAVYVHENLEAYHANGQAKYLESVLNESAQFMMARITKRIDLNRAKGK